LAKGLLVGLICGCVVGGAILAGAALRHGAASVVSGSESGSADAIAETADLRQPEAGQVSLQAEAPAVSEIQPGPVMVASTLPPEPSSPSTDEVTRAGQIAPPEAAATAPEGLPGPVIAAAPPAMPEPAPSAAGFGVTRAPGLHAPADMPAAPATAPAPDAAVIAPDAPEPTPPPLGTELAGRPGATAASRVPEAPDEAVARIGMGGASDEAAPVPPIDFASAGPPSAPVAPAITEATTLAPASVPGPAEPLLPSLGSSDDAAQRSRQALLAPAPGLAATPRIDPAPPEPATTTFDRNRLPPAAGELPMIAFLVESPRSDLQDWSMSFVGSRPPEDGAESFRSANGVAFRSAGSIITQDTPPETAISAAATTGEALVVFPRDASVCVEAAEQGVPCAQVYTRLRRDDERNGYRLDSALLRAQRDGIAIVALPDDNALRELVDDWLQRHRSEIAVVPVSTIIDRWR
jgi:hypothetical protein